MSTVQFVTCDVCGIVIKDTNENRIDAQVYGVDFHIDCFKKLKPGEVLSYLSIDDLYIGKEHTKSTASVLKKYDLL